MSDIALKIRQCKRSGGTEIDLSGLGLTSLPSELIELTSLEKVNLSNNSLSSIDSIGILSDCKELVLSRNKISALPEELKKLEKLETLRLDTNPIAVSNPGLAAVFGTFSVKREISSYFSKSGSSDTPGFLSGGTGINDTAALRKKVSELQQEVKSLKAGAGSSVPAASSGGPSWLSNSGPGFGGGMERPTTASSQSRKIADLERELNAEKLKAKRFQQDSERLSAELRKNATLQSTAQSDTDGRIKGISGVREIEFSEIEQGQEIGQGGFSVIKKGKWRGTDIAAKIIFDPVMSDELLEEITNEVRMLSILRHPNIVLLMGMCSKPPNMVILFENVELGSLFNYLHQTQKPLEMPERLRIARDVAKAFEFIGDSGIVHRDMKSLNILIDSSLNIKVCDFGLARFKADLNTGSSQFSGTPTYMAPELF